MAQTPTDTAAGPAVDTPCTGEPSTGELSTAELIEQLQQDRLWLLRQLDSGRWPQWRYDLAALERELGQLLEQASDRFPPR